MSCRGSRPHRSAAVLLVAAAVAAGCGPERQLAPTRGVILISLDTLAAAHLGTYGYERDTSPFFDALAERGVLFENAIVQYPSTLVSHVSIFTGLYPEQHGVYPPASVPSPEIATLPERLRAAGYATAAFTEGGYVSAEYGFDRGFDRFESVEPSGRRHAEATFRRGIDYLRELDAARPFFLFLHTYAVHAPYQPPPPLDALFWEGERPPVPESFGPFLDQVNQGEIELGERGADWYRSQYDAEIRYLDGELERFFAELDALGLAGETTVVVTSDHGEAFLQHGSLAHEQVYPEELRVPLLVLHPEIEPRRVPDLVESVDLAPTLLDLAGLPPLRPAGGASLRPRLEGAAPAARSTAFAEVRGRLGQRTLLVREDDGVRQALTSSWMPDGDRGGAWFSREAVFDTERSRLDLRMVSFHQPRTVSVEVDGEPLSHLVVHTAWNWFPVDLPGEGRRRVRLTTRGCDVPRRVGAGDDPRCLSVKVDGVDLERAELYDWRSDPGAADDLSRRDPAALRRLLRELDRTRWSRVAEPSAAIPSESTRRELRALGYAADP